MVQVLRLVYEMSATSFSLTMTMYGQDSGRDDLCSAV